MPGLGKSRLGAMVMLSLGAIGSFNHPGTSKAVWANYGDDILSGRRGAGICMAVQQRSAKKKRNVKRHRKACRK